MKHLTLTTLTALGLATMSPLTHAQSSSPGASKGKSWSKADVDSMCERPTDTPIPKDGYQYDGKKASEDVMTLKAGKYRYPLGGAMLVWPDERYLLKLPSSRKGIFGTDGDDLLAKGGIVGGCSSEQLSEAIRNNELTLKDFELVKTYE